jgi:hypothetical protein
MRFLRQSIGPLIIGLAAWCAAGTLAVASPASATSRVAALAPWWIAVGAFAVAFAISRFRDSPWTATPALLSVVPWLPIPMTPALLICTGPMAWAPVLLAFALAIGLAPVTGLFRMLKLFEPDDATVAALLLAGALGGLSAWAADPRTPGGDEPHYLIITQSILHDGDLDIANQHARREYSSFIGIPLNPDLRRRGIHGEAYSIHAPGVSALVAPLFQFFGYTGARVMIILVTAIGGMLIWRIGWRATDSPEAAWFAWAAVVLTPTFAVHSFTVYPDGPGLLAVAAGVLLLVQLARGDVPGLLPVALTSMALASLPWLHTRLAILAGGLGAVIALRLVTMDAPARVRVIRLSALFVIPLISAAFWFYSFKVHYGTFDPRAPYPPEASSLAWIGPAILGLFFDGQFGIAAYAPAVAVAFAGLLMAPAKTSRRLLVELGVIALVYLAAITTIRMWQAGRPAPPARFVMALLPMLAVPLAIAWSRVTQSSRALLAGFAGCGAAVTAVVLSVDHAVLALSNDRTGQPLWLEWLSPVANLSRVWPSFYWNEPRFPIHALLVVGIAAALWGLINRRNLKPRVAATLWAIATMMILAPVGWAYTGAQPLDPPSAQLAVVRAAGEGRQLVALGAGSVSYESRNAAGGTLRIDAPEPGVIEPPPVLALSNVPAARFVARVRSTSAFPVKLRLWIGRRDRQTAPWREFDVPGAGEFTFPFLVPAATSGLVIDTDPAARAALRVELSVDGVVKDPGVPVRTAVRYPAAGVLFLDDMTYPERDGFWVRGKADAEFLVVPDNAAGPPATVRLLVRNGASQNQVSVESGTFQRLLVMSPGQEQELEIPAGAGGGIRVRVASGSGFVPSEKNPGTADHRSLGVWIEIR